MVVIIIPAKLNGFTYVLIQWSVVPMWPPPMAKGTDIDPARVASQRNAKSPTMYLLLLKIALIRKKNRREVAGTAIP